LLEAHGKEAKKKTEKMKKGVGFRRPKKTLSTFQSWTTSKDENRGRNGGWG